MSKDFNDRWEPPKDHKSNQLSAMLLWIAIAAFVGFILTINWIR